MKIRQMLFPLSISLTLYVFFYLLLLVYIFNIDMCIIAIHVYTGNMHYSILYQVWEQIVSPNSLNRNNTVRVKYLTGAELANFALVEGILRTEMPLKSFNQFCGSPNWCSQKVQGRMIKPSHYQRKKHFNFGNRHLAASCKEDILLPDNLRLRHRVSSPKQI